MRMLCMTGGWVAATEASPQAPTHRTIRVSFALQANSDWKLLRSRGTAARHGAAANQITSAASAAAVLPIAPCCLRQEPPRTTMFADRDAAPSGRTHKESGPSDPVSGR